jgi:hypothetical protein
VILLLFTKMNDLVPIYQAALEGYKSELSFLLQCDRVDWDDVISKAQGAKDMQVWIDKLNGDT